MALHIRDFRQSDVAGLSSLCSAGHVLGRPLTPGAATRILCGLRGSQLACAIWFAIEGETGLILAAAVTDASCWQSDVQELVAEAGLWLASRGAAAIELRAFPSDAGLLSTLWGMGFCPDERAGLVRRLVLAPNAA